MFSKCKETINYYFSPKSRLPHSPDQFTILHRHHKYLQEHWRPRAHICAAATITICIIIYQMVATTVVVTDTIARFARTLLAYIFTVYLYIPRYELSALSKCSVLTACMLTLNVFNQSVEIYIAPLQDSYSEALLTQAKWKRTVLRRWWNWEQATFGRCLRSTGSPFQVFGPTNHRKWTGLHCRRVGEWDHQITVSRGPECTTACTWGERAAELSQIGGRPARQAPPHQGCELL